MGLLDQMMGAVSGLTGQDNEPNGIGALLSQVQNIPGAEKLDPGMIQSVLNIATGQVQGALKEKVNTDGLESVQGLVGQAITQGSQGGNILGMLLNGAQQQNMVQAVAQKTGLENNMIQGLLPMLMPMIMNMMQGSGNHAAAGQNMLTSFLDTNHDGKTDLMDMLSMAGQFMKK
jgi:hypothetical protein